MADNVSVESESNFLVEDVNNNQIEDMKFMAIVGILIWISGIWCYIIFEKILMYLFWFSKQLGHHQWKLLYCKKYLILTKELGGNYDGIGIHGYQTHGYIDAYRGSGLTRRSVVAGKLKMDNDSGEISMSVLSNGMYSVYLSSFICEYVLDGGLWLVNKSKMWYIRE